MVGLNFWRRLRKWAQKHEREAFLERHCVNLKCPHCKTWMADAESPGHFASFGHPIATSWRCGHCERPSAWVCEAGFWFTAEEFLGECVTMEQPK